MDGERIVYLFSYGTLQQESVQIASFGRLLKGADDALLGYKQSMIEITDPDVIRKSGKNFHPIVVATDNPRDEVPGKVFEITEAELAAADAYEVSDYKRVSAPLKSGVDAWVYVRA
ncbi:gamma-glutamylcyclotransferase family protein [Methylocapsa sp. S129]|uniref:gamma-glutamylcyclotransferase family protein n=1 Tax=Methylocapsa sp. S129 TaxID=1641869 RepID=UPI00131C7ABA|nr:gamma-glutamylcyclotransferase family protein [Methylocapsa sp. S129]